MGCFDEVTIHCPNPRCGAPNTEQSKGGNCNLDLYSLADAPVAVLADIDDPLYCAHCGIKYRLKIVCITQPVVIEDENTDDIDDCDYVDYGQLL